MTRFIVQIMVLLWCWGDTMEIINFNLRIPEELNEKIIKIAQEQGRSKNKQIEQIIKEYVQEYEKNKNKELTTNTSH